MNEYFPVYLQGIFTGASLIIAIGAQNAFVLTRAIRGEHALAVAALCAFIDLALITAGVMGMGTLVASNAVLGPLAALGGAAFLLYFGLHSLLEARKSQGLSIRDESTPPPSLASALAATLAVSLLNPHVYLDTVLMLGTISGNYPGTGRYWFGAGAGTASVLWFFTLSLAGRALAPVFRKPKSWQILHVLVALMVWWVAFGLLRDFFATR